jgi:hypothetical protein
MPKTLVEKLAEIAHGTPNLLKQGDNGEYKFLTAVDVFEAVRSRMFAAGIVIYPVSQTVERSQPYLTVTDNATDEVRTTITYRITDGESEMDCVACGIGQDHEGKALYMASTGAKKDLLKTIFLLAGYEDDAERIVDVERVPDGLAEKLDEMEKKFGPDLREHPISRRDVIAWGKACQMSKKRNAEREAYLDSLGINKITDMKRKDFAAAIAWATNE